MKRSLHAFTLIEMLMVMVIIAIIASLIVGVSGYANKRSAAVRTEGEIKAISSAAENFKTDNGTYPRQEGITETASGTGAAPIDPRIHGNPTSTEYTNASLFLYQQLTGDVDRDGRGADLVGSDRMKSYFEPKPSNLARQGGSGSSGTPSPVSYLQDPYGNSYGYSTAALRAEEAYRELARATTKVGKEYKQVDRGEDYIGFNGASFDLWSTAGSTGASTDELRKKWVKNW